LWTATCPISGSTYHLLTVCTSAFPVTCLLKFSQRSGPCSSTLLRCIFSIPPPLLCACFQFVVYSGLFWGGSVCPVGYAGLSQGWLGQYHIMLGAHLFGLPNVSQAGLKLASGGGRCPPVFSVNVLWRIFLWARGSGCQSFDSLCCFISTKCDSSISARFLIHGAHPASAP
jgi:hypothetical protein